MSIPDHKELRLRNLLAAGLIVGSVIASALLVSQEVRADSLEDQSTKQPESSIYYDQLGIVPEGASGYTIATRWEENKVTYSFYNCPTSLDCAQAQQVVRDALETWDSVSGITLDEVASPGDIDIAWSTDDFVMDGPGGYLGYTFFPYFWLGNLAGDMILDDGEFWVLDIPENEDQIHLFTVVLHESGHALGLDHTDNPDALMWPIYVGVRGLHQDDIDGIQALYGPPDENDQGDNQTPPAEPEGITITANNTLRLRSGPSTDYSQVGTLPDGSTAPILGRDAVGDWVYVEHEGIRGWAAAWLGTIDGDLNAIPVVDNDGSGAPPTDPVEPDVPSEPSMATATAEVALRIRSGPDVEYPEMGSLPPNTKVVVQGRNPENTWFLIEYENTKGWIAAWLTTLEGSLDGVPVIVDG